MKKFTKIGIFSIGAILLFASGCTVDGGPSSELSGVGHKKGSASYLVHDDNAARTATNTAETLQEVKKIGKNILDQETVERLIDALNRNSEALEKLSEANSQPQQ